MDVDGGAPVDAAAVEVAVTVVEVVDEVVVVVSTGAPPPVSVAVVPVVDGWSVSVEPAVLSAGFWRHAAKTMMRPAARKTFLIANVGPASAAPT